MDRNHDGQAVTRRSEELLPLPGHDAVYRLKRSSARRTLALRVTDAGEVCVNAPLRLPRGEIEAFLARHDDWLRQSLQRAHTRVFAWHEGALLPWLGGALTLGLAPGSGQDRVHLEEDRLLCAADPASVPALVKRWYQDRAHILLAERLAKQCAHAGLAFPPLRLSDARTRWGSLSPRGVVSLNWRLVKASPVEIDYVICHELAHFRQRNHSRAFWQEVERLCPAWAEARRLLRRNTGLYFRF